MTETSMITLRSLAQDAARLRLETLVLAKWHVFGSDRVGLTAGEVMLGAEKLIQEIVDFLDNPSGALVSHLIFFVSSRYLMYLQIVVEGQEPQPGHLHTAIVALYTDFFLSGELSLRKRADALSAHWQPMWPKFRKENPRFKWEANHIDLEALNINLVPFKQYAPAGGFTMLMSAVCCCPYSCTCPLTILYSFFRERMSFSKHLRRSLQRGVSARKHLPRQGKNSTLNHSNRSMTAH